MNVFLGCLAVAMLALIAINLAMIADHLKWLRGHLASESVRRIGGG
jgi:hypothetical protein